MTDTPQALVQKGSVAGVPFVTGVRNALAYQMLLSFHLHRTVRTREAFTLSLC